MRPVEQYPIELAAHAARDVARRRETIRPWSCSRPASTTRRTSSTRSSRATWASTWSSRPTCSSTTTRSTCAPRTARAACTSSTAASTTPTSTPSSSGPDSLLGVPGLMRAYAAGSVTLVNAPGNGCADDKAVYPFVPDMIRYYLGEEPILAQVDTYVCAREDDNKYVLEHLDKLVVKAVDEAGGYGMLMGPQSTARRREEFRKRILAEPRKYIAQHRIELSTCPTWDPERERLAPRRVDLRPFVLTRPDGCLGAAGRSHARRAASRARTSSTPARAAAPRTPGCSGRTAHDFSRRRSLLLVRSIHRAHREHRAPLAGHAHAGVRRRHPGHPLLAAARHRVG